MKINLLKVSSLIVLTGIAVTLVYLSMPTATIQAHDQSLIDRTIDIEMSEFTFTVDGEAGGTVTLQVGETVTLNFTNVGNTVHDAHFGLEPNLEDRLYENNIVAPFDMLVLDREGNASLTFTPTEAGTFELGCFQFGHYEAGMNVPFVIEG